MITRDLERLEGVADTLGAAIREARAGRRVKLPVIQPADAAGLVVIMHEQLDAAIAQRTDEAAREGLTIACAPGCAACCAAPVVVSEAEAVAVAEWLADRPELRDQLARSYPAWRARAGALATRLEAVRDPTAHEALVRELREHHVMCAFNREGLCSIYEVRPARCRKVHALDTNEKCQPTSDGRVRYFEHAPTEATFDEQEPMRGALHQALRPNANLVVLVAAVYRLVFARTPRNGPCPCGSTKKHKHCCA
ncbi:MAG: YkgJ family cysteine cluster protein [Kofleriaceae bacterium]